MKSILLNYLSKFPNLSETDRDAIADNIQVESFKKGTILLHEGEVARYCYFVLQGCVRQYSIIDGEEKTTAFMTEEQAVVSFTSYAQQVPADHYFACVEDCVLIMGDPRSEMEMYARFPQLVTLTRTMMEQDFGKTQAAFAKFIASSPEERYRQLLDDRPDLLRRAPQHQIASYLGVTPESLSRIRKRILKKG